MSMEPERKKRKLDLGTVVEDGEENQLVSTLTETVGTLCKYFD